MYTKVFPLLNEFQNENAIEDRFENIAKCYGVCETNGKEAIIVNNLKSQGFEVYNRTEPQNLNHVIFVFRNYARLHALSLAMKIKKPSLFKALTKNMGDVFGMFMVKSNINLQMEKDFDNAIKIFQKYNDSATAKKFEIIRNNIKDIVTNLGNSTNPASVIIHGDCWNNNMMFKYEVTTSIFIVFLIIVYCVPNRIRCQLLTSNVNGLFLEVGTIFFLRLTVERNNKIYSFEFMALDSILIQSARTC